MVKNTSKLLKKRLHENEVIDRRRALSKADEKRVLFLLDEYRETFRKLAEYDKKH